MAVYNMPPCTPNWLDDLRRDFLPAKLVANIDKMPRHEVQQLRKALRAVPDFPGYIISASGDVFRLIREYSRSYWGPIGKKWAPGGYYNVPLCLPNGAEVLRRIDKLVLVAFVGPCPPDHYVKHKNGRLDDNHIDNLAWQMKLGSTAVVTRVDNQAYHWNAEEAAVLPSGVVARFTIMTVEERHRVRNMSKPILHYPAYCVTGTGRVFMHTRNEWQEVPGDLAAGGYMNVVIAQPNGVFRVRRIDKLVLGAFVGPCPRDHHAAHRNGDLADNDVDNLYWKAGPWQPSGVYDTV